MLKRTTLWLIFLVAIISGLGLSKVFILPVPVWLPLLFLLPALKRRSLSVVIFLLLTGLSLGLWRGEHYEQKLAIYDPLYARKITLIAVAGDDGVYNAHKQLSFTAGDIKVNGRSLPGKMVISGFGTNAVLQGDEVRATGKLYSSRGGYQAQMSYAKLNVLKHHQTILSDSRRRFVNGLETSLPEPLGAFAAGLLIGQRSTLPAGVKNDLLKAGLIHIVAVSGYNLTIILNAVRKLLAKQSKRLALIGSLLLVVSFLAITGASASITRAALVSSFSLTAAYYGRRFKALNLIVLAAAITAWVSPIYLWSDIGWWLSFLAFFGILVLAPLVNERFMRGKTLSLMAGIALESFCAELMTIPLILYVFGQLSLIGLIANVLIVSLVPLAMLLSFIAGLAGMFASVIAGWFAWPAKLMLNYMLDLVHILARGPGSFLSGIKFSLSDMVFCYVALAGFCLVLEYKSSTKNVIITDENQPKLDRSYQFVRTQ